jgi:hypothetical protein
MVACVAVPPPNSAPRSFKMFPSPAKRVTRLSSWLAPVSEEDRSFSSPARIVGTKMLKLFWVLAGLSPTTAAAF